MNSVSQSLHKWVTHLNFVQRMAISRCRYFNFWQLDVAGNYYWRCLPWSWSIVMVGRQRVSAIQSAATDSVIICMHLGSWDRTCMASKELVYTKKIMSFAIRSRRREMCLTFTNYKMKSQEHQFVCHGNPLHRMSLIIPLYPLPHLNAHQNKDQKLACPVQDVRWSHVEQKEVLTQWSERYWQTIKSACW
jgi:hypothetical protein